MRKLSIFIFITCFALIGLSFQAMAQAIIEPPSSIEFDRSQVIIPCPPGGRSKSGGCSDQQIVGVRTSWGGPESKPKDYKWKVSGGKIIGTGRQVNWDLTGVKSGIYSISIFFSGEKFNKLSSLTRTKFITVKECLDCILDCFCAAKVSISSSLESVKLGDTVVFAITIYGGGMDPTYDWKISGGKIIKGRGTREIIVSTKGINNKTLTASVKINDCPECVNEFSKTIEIIQPKSKKKN